MQQASEYCCQGRAHSLGSHQVRESLLPRVHTDRVAEIDEGGRYHRPKSVRRITRTRPSLSESIPHTGCIKP